MSFECRFPCADCPVLKREKLKRALDSDDQMVRKAGETAVEFLKRGDSGEYGPVYIGTPVDENGYPATDVYYCCNPNGVPAANVVGDALRISRITSQDL